MVGKSGATYFPFIGGFCKENGDEAEEGRFVGEKTGAAGAPLGFAIHGFAPVENVTLLISNMDALFWSGPSIELNVGYFPTI